MHRILCPREERQKAAVCCKALGQSLTFKIPQPEIMPGPSMPPASRAHLRNKTCPNLDFSLENLDLLVNSEGETWQDYKEEVWQAPT